MVALLTATDDLETVDLGTLEHGDRGETEEAEADVLDEESQANCKHPHPRLRVHLDGGAASSHRQDHYEDECARAHPVLRRQALAQRELASSLHLVGFVADRTDEILGLVRDLDEPSDQAVVVDRADVSLAAARLDEFPGVRPLSVVADPALTAFARSLRTGAGGVARGAPAALGGLLRGVRLGERGQDLLRVEEPELLWSDAVPEDAGEPESHSDLNNSENHHAGVARCQIHLFLPELGDGFAEQEANGDHHHDGL